MVINAKLTFNRLKTGLKKWMRTNDFFFYQKMTFFENYNNFNLNLILTFIFQSKVRNHRMTLTK